MGGEESCDVVFDRIYSFNKPSSSRPDGGRARAVFTDIHHPTDVLLLGGVGAMACLLFPGCLKIQGKKYNN